MPENKPYRNAADMSVIKGEILYFAVMKSTKSNVTKNSKIEFMNIY
jgi:hypothetical protein